MPVHDFVSSYGRKYADADYDAHFTWSFAMCWVKIDGQTGLMKGLFR